MKRDLEYHDLELTNFGSWRSLQFNLHNRGKVLIVGKVGVGKSTIPVGAYWTATGDTPNPRPADEIINEEAGKNTSGKLTFRRGKHLYEITRYRKHNTWKNKVILTKDGKRFGEKDSKVGKINKAIENLLGSKEELKHTLLYAQRSASFASIGDSEQKKLIEEMTELKIIPKAEKIAKERFSNIILQLNILAERLSQQEEAIATTKQLQQKQKEKVAKHDKVIQASIKEAKSRLRDAKADLEAFTKDLETAEKEQKKVSDRIVEVEAMNSVLKDEIEKLNKRKNKLEKLTPGSKCDRCGSVMSEDNIKESISTIDTEIVKIETNRAEHRLTIKKLNEELQALGSVKKLRRGSVEAEKKIEKWRQYLRSKKNELGGNDDAVTPINQTLITLTANRYRTLMMRRFFKKMRRVTKHLLKGFAKKGYIRNAMLPTILKALEEKANDYLSVFNIIQVKYSLEDGRIKQRYQRLRGENPKLRSYASLSGGEQSIVGRSTDLALHDIAEQSKAAIADCVFLDEPWEGLEDDDIKKIPELLKKINKKTVIVISHSKELRPYFNNIIEVENRKGISSFANG